MVENKEIEEIFEKENNDKIVVLGDIGMATVYRSDFFFSYDAEQGEISVSSTVSNIEVPIQIYGDPDATEVFKLAYDKLQTEKVLNLCEIVNEVIKS